MTEPDVALTDFALALECALLARWLARRPGSTARGWIAVLLAATSVGAAAGGLEHGFFLDPASAGQRLLWPTALVAVGIAAFAGWNAAAHAGGSAASARRSVGRASVALSAWTAAVVAGVRSFTLAAAGTAIAAVALLAAFARQGAAGRPAVAGLALVLGGAAAREAGAALPVLGLGPNALYHVVEGAGLALVAAAARRLPGRIP